MAFRGGEHGSKSSALEMLMERSGGEADDTNAQREYSRTLAVRTDTLLDVVPGGVGPGATDEVIRIAVDERIDVGVVGVHQSDVDADRFHCFSSKFARHDQPSVLIQLVG